MNSMKLLVSASVSWALLSGASVAATKTLAGAGGSSPAPLLNAWGKSYETSESVALTYDSVNSAYGIDKIKSSAVDFADTEAPLSDADLKSFGVMQFPFTISGVTPVANIPGVQSGELKLDGAVLSEIFMGKITQWNDAKIKALNPKLDLPDWPITVAHRSDNSGLTLQLTAYLSEVSPAWEAGPGVGQSVTWPAGLGGKGNAGIAAIMTDTVGTIGYVEYAYAKANKLDLVTLKTHDGDYITPQAATFTAAASRTDWKGSVGLSKQLVNQPGENAWPIVAVSYALIRKDAAADKRDQTLKYFSWGLDKGDGAAISLGYAPLPQNLKAIVKNRIQHPSDN